jgi:hypothetical protein
LSRMSKIVSYCTKFKIYHSYLVMPVAKTSLNIGLRRTK